jgi:hypothetical protein
MLPSEYKQSLLWVSLFATCQNFQRIFHKLYYFRQIKYFDSEFRLKRDRRRGQTPHRDPVLTTTPTQNLKQ